MNEALEIFNGILDQSEDWKLSQWESVIERCDWAKAYALREIRDKRLYLETHFTWETYCNEKHGISARHADRQIAAIPSVENLGPLGLKISTERQIREVVSLPPAQQREVWQAAVETAPEGKVTASHIRSVVNHLTNAEPQNGVREMYRAEAREAGLTPQQEAAADFGVGWHKNLHKHWVFYNSLRDHGGIAKLARKWSKEVKQNNLTELCAVRDCINECIEYFEKELGK